MNVKKLFLAISVCIAIGMTSCDSHEGKDISQYNDASSADSLLFYYVQLRAHEYWELAEKDTSLRSPEARARFLEGLEKGFNSIKTGDADYNRGVELGVRMAINLQKFEKMYDVDIHKDMAVPSFRYGLRDGADIPEFNYQESFYRILNRLKQVQRDRDHEKARLSLVEEAREQQMSKISDDLYYRLLKKGEGPYAQYGQSAYVVVNYERADGEDIAVPSPGLVTIGALGVPEVLNRSYSRLNKGSVALFATTAEALFGSRTYIMGMKPEDVLLVTITLNEIISPHTTPVDSI